MGSDTKISSAWEFEKLMDEQAPDSPTPYPSPDHGVRAILFDLDGVLVDAADWHRDAFNLALDVHCINPLNQEDHMRNFNGLSSKRKLSILAERGVVPDSKQLMNSIHAAKQQYTIKLIEKNCKPLARVIDVLTYVRSIKMKTAMVTNCSRETAELMLRKSKLAGMFDTTVTNGDVDGKIKPHPWPFLLARHNLKEMSSKSCLAIDDTDKGIISAVEAGCRTWRLNIFKDLTVTNLMNLLTNLRITI